MNSLLPLLLYAYSVVINPHPVLLNPGEEADIEVKLIDETGKNVRDVKYNLSIVPPYIARVRDGKIIGLKEGIGVLIATVRYRDDVYTGYSVVRVGRRMRLRVLVEPGHANVAPEDTIKFHAFVKLPRRMDLIEPDSVEWFVLPSSIGKINNGILISGKHRGLGRVVAVAEFNGLKGIGSAGLLVGELKDKIYRVHIIPRFAHVQPGDTLVFNYKLDNHPPNGELKVKWIVDPPFIGHFEGNKFIPDVQRGRAAVVLWVEDSEGKFGFSRGMVMIGHMPRNHRPHRAMQFMHRP